MAATARVIWLAVRMREVLVRPWVGLCAPLALSFFLFARNTPCTLHLSRSHGDRWGATDLQTLSLHLTLFSDSLRVSQNFNPVYSKMLFSKRFFCRPLLLPPYTVPYKIVSAHLADLDTWPNHFKNLRFFTVVKKSSSGPMACGLILSLTASLVM